MLPPDYTEAVLADYHKKKAANELPFDMKQLSPARFKTACLEVRRERYDRKDEKLLKAFFGEANDQKACLQAIAECKIDKFRPLINFLKEKTSTRTDDKNVELLAWLINFKDRPCEYDKKYNLPDPEKSQDKSQGFSSEVTIEVQEKEVGQKEDEISNPTPSGQERARKKSRRVILIITISVALGMTAYLRWTGKSSTPVVTGHEGCMFWANDHFQPVSCSKKLENTLVIGLDSEMIAHFKKITRPDTITLKAIGSVWYVKYRGMIEFYTDSGFHPIDPNLRLKPITGYIVRKYIHGENIQEEPGK